MPNSSPAKRRAKLLQLIESEGFASEDALLSAAIADSVCPAICLNDDCDYTCEMEPDQTQDYCEVCGTGSMASALILAGLI